MAPPNGRDGPPAYSTRQGRDSPNAYSVSTCTDRKCPETVGPVQHLLGNVTAPAAGFHLDLQVSMRAVYPTASTNGQIVAQYVVLAGVGAVVPNLRISQTHRAAGDVDAACAEADVPPSSAWPPRARCPAETNHLSSRLIARAKIWSECPSNVLFRPPVSASQTMRTPALSPEKSYLPSPLTARLRTSLSCPWRVRTAFPVAASQILTLQRSFPRRSADRRG